MHTKSAGCLNNRSKRIIARSLSTNALYSGLSFISRRLQIDFFELHFSNRYESDMK